MPLAAGFVGILPALGLLDEEKDGTPPLILSWMAAIGWSCSVAFFGYVSYLALQASTYSDPSKVSFYRRLYGNKL